MGLISNFSKFNFVLGIFILKHTKFAELFLDILYIPAERFADLLPHGDGGEEEVGHVKPGRPGRRQPLQPENKNKLFTIMIIIIFNIVIIIILITIIIIIIIIV